MGIQRILTKFNKMRLFSHKYTLIITISSLISLIFATLVLLISNDRLIYNVISSIFYIFFGWGLLALLLAENERNLNLSKMIENPEKGSLAYEYESVEIVISKIGLGVELLFLLAGTVLYFGIPIVIFYITFKQ